MAGQEFDAIFSEPIGAGTASRSLTLSAIESISFDARDLETNLYRYTYTFNTFFGARITSSGGGGGSSRSISVPTEDSTRRSADIDGDVAVLNYTESPYGAGWGLAGISRLHFRAPLSTVEEGGGFSTTSSGSGTGTITQTFANGDQVTPEFDDMPVMMDTGDGNYFVYRLNTCLLYTSPSPRDLSTSRMPSSA